ncbi:MULTISPECIES: hypothetical protein [Bacilli]|uniref:hypothetical protein n=1 Tax=Bacilli TaxID=91061 RepID=UPI002041A86B|nr:MULTISPECIES: hypothetical protein [Bacilli]MCM3032915.1 hypothetical protein [Niallia sp. MER 6]MDK8746869.1 hypothetical protein [Streptococcus agalactiae]
MLVHNSSEKTVIYYKKKSHFQSDGNLVEIYSVNKQTLYPNSVMVEDEVLAAEITETPIDQLTSEFRFIIEMGNYDLLAEKENISEVHANELIRKIEMTIIH